MHGIFLLNKPQGMTSNHALQRVKRLFGAAKAGHTGTLDPLATGMLPICLGEATKISQYLLDADKCYETTGLLGIQTNTADSTGDVIARISDFSVSVTQLNEALSQFKGPISQVPSMFSALKHQGVPLYRLARKGIEIERPARNIMIHSLELTHFDGNYFSLTVTCSKGTYIRNLLADIGHVLTTGAHLTQLHRVFTNGFEHHPMYSLDDLITMSASEKQQCLIAMDTPINHMSSVVLSPKDVQFIRQGQLVPNQLQTEEAQTVRLYTEQGDFIGLGEQQINGNLKAKRLLSF
jgi:tRNA pseudouridine55 synthase